MSTDFKGAMEEAVQHIRTLRVSLLEHADALSDGSADAVAPVVMVDGVTNAINVARAELAGLDRTLEILASAYANRRGEVLMIRAMEAERQRRAKMN